MRSLRFMLGARSGLILSALFSVAGCGQTTMVWNKPAASAAEFNTDNYRCMQQSQQQTSSAYVDRYGGRASSGQSTNGPLFHACMNAAGWSLQQDHSREAQAEFKDAENHLARICADPKYAPYYSKNSL